MRASDTNFIDLIRINQQLEIPIYQRKYSWDKKQCNQLFDDVENIGKTDKNHFMGPIVYRIITDPMHKLIIIDGQQRMTTLSLLLASIANFLIETPEYEEILNIPSRRIVNKYLLNVDEEGDDKYKLRLTDDDNIIYKKIIDSITPDTELILNEREKNSKVYGIFDHYSRKLKEENIEHVWKGMQKLTLVTIQLEDELPQVIFESLNSTGKTLEDTDLIRNFLLMNLNPREQRRLYNTYWRHIEKEFEEAKINNKKEKFEGFISAYLNIIYKNAVSTKIYDEFRQAATTFDSIEMLVQNVNKYWIFYEKIVFEREENQKLLKSFKSLNRLPYKTMRPFIMRLYEDYDNGDLDLDDFIEIINLTESYMFRRSICNLDSQSLKGFFSKMYTHLDKDGLLEHYKYLLYTASGKKEMPRNEDFEKHFKSEDIFNSNIKNYVLLRLNEGERDEMTHTENCTVEHIMPQNTNLSIEWQEELGLNDWKRVHEKYLHTIGNLTLTASNAKLGDKTFKEKKEMPEYGYLASQLNINDYLENIHKWDEVEIIKRANYLYEQAKNIWEFPEISSETKDKYDNMIIEPDEEESGIQQTIPENENYLYWSECNDLIRENPDKYENFRLREPPSDNRYIFRIGTNEAYLKLSIKIDGDEVKSQLYIPDNKPLFDYLYNQRDEIESELDKELIFESPENQKSSSISLIKTFDLSDGWNYKKSITWQLDTAEELRKALKRRIDEFLG